jgi:hypothetical protein
MYYLPTVERATVITRKILKPSSYEVARNVSRVVSGTEKKIPTPIFHGCRKMQLKGGQSHLR